IPRINSAKGATVASTHTEPSQPGQRSESDIIGLGIIGLQALHPGYDVTQDWAFTVRLLTQLRELLERQITARQPGAAAPDADLPPGKIIAGLVAQQAGSIRAGAAVDQITAITTVLTAVTELIEARGEVRNLRRLENLITLLRHVERRP